MKLSTTVLVAARTIEVAVRKQFGLPLRPYKLLLELTSDCNSRCKTCSIWKTPKRVRQAAMSFEQIERILFELGNDLVWLALSGGEVTLRADFKALVASAKRFCPQLRLVTFTTNGLLPKVALDYALAIRNAELDCFITVSLDGDRETHDRLRGVPGNYDLAHTTLQLLRANGIRSHFGITVSQHNEQFIQTGYSAIRNDVKAVTFLHGGGIYAQPNSRDDASIIRSLEVIGDQYVATAPDECLEWIYIRLALQFLRAGRSKSTIPCTVGHTSLHVRPDGGVMHCMFMPEVGNAKEVPSLRRLVNSPRSKAQLDAIASDRCPHCWMNCYAPHSVLVHPWRALAAVMRAEKAGIGRRASFAWLVRRILRSCMSTPASDGPGAPTILRETTLAADIPRSNNDANKYHQRSGPVPTRPSRDVDLADLRRGVDCMTAKQRLATVHSASEDANLAVSTCLARTAPLHNQPTRTGASSS